MTWQRGINKSGEIDNYFITNGNANICKVTVDGILWYELWINRRYVDKFKTVEEAKSSHEKRS